MILGIWNVEVSWKGSGVKSYKCIVTCGKFTGFLSFLFVFRVFNLEWQLYTQVGMEYYSTDFRLQSSKNMTI